MTSIRPAPGRPHRLVAVLLLACAAPPLLAADDAALDIADRIGERISAPDAPAARDWQLSLEATAGSTWARDGSGATAHRSSVAPTWSTPTHRRGR